MTFYTGRLFPAWNGDLFVAAMAGKHVARLVLDGERVLHPAPPLHHTSETT